MSHLIRIYAVFTSVFLKFQYDMAWMKSLWKFVFINFVVCFFFFCTLRVRPVNFVMVIAEADGIEDMEEIDEEANQEMDTTTSSKEETADKTETSGGEAETSGGEEKKEEDKNELTVTVKDKEKQELEDKIPFPESLKKCKCSRYFIYSIIRFKFLLFQNKSTNRDPFRSLYRFRFLELFWNRKNMSNGQITLADLHREKALSLAKNLHPLAGLHNTVGSLSDT